MLIVQHIQYLQVLGYNHHQEYHLHAESNGIQIEKLQHKNELKSKKYIKDDIKQTRY